MPMPGPFARHFLQNFQPTMKRFAFPLSVILLLAFLFPLMAKAEANSQPNIIVILADDLGYSDLGGYGGEIETPAS